MTEEPQPTNAEILAAVRALAGDLAGVKGDVAGLRVEFAQHRTETQHSFDQLRADIAQVRADVVAVKADTAYTERYIGDLQTAVRRHIDDPDAHHRAA